MPRRWAGVEASPGGNVVLHLSNMQGLALMKTGADVVV
jgi:hypothetical protein